MNIELSLDELILHGFDSAERAAMVTAVERALASLLAERGLPSVLPQGRAMIQHDGGVFTIAPHSSLEALGAQVAQAIYRGLHA